MSGKWYYVKHAQRFGLFTFEQFRQMAGAGMVQPDDRVCDGEGQQWVSANAVEGLFDCPPPRTASNSAPAKPPNATPRHLGLGDWTLRAWTVFLIAVDMAILHLWVCAWFGLDYSRLLWFPTMMLAVTVAGLALAVAGPCSVACCAKEMWSSGRPGQGSDWGASVRPTSAASPTCKGAGRQ